MYAGWQDDLKICHEHMGMRGLRLYPRWHNYRLDSKPCLALVQAATERGLIVSLPMRVEDPRTNWLVNVPDVPLTEVAELVKACPKAHSSCQRLALMNTPLGPWDNGLPAITSWKSRAQRALTARSTTHRRAGADRLVSAPECRSAIRCVLLKLEVLSASMTRTRSAGTTPRRGCNEPVGGNGYRKLRRVPCFWAKRRLDIAAWTTFATKACVDVPLAN